MDSPAASSVTLSIHSDEGIEAGDMLVPGIAHDSNDRGLENDFIPPDKYLQFTSEDSLSPSMKAASNPDPRILSALLRNSFTFWEKRSRTPECSLESDYASGYFNESCKLDYPSEFTCHALRSNGRSIIGVTTPLMEAIGARLLTNIRTLLDAGANPDGIPFHVIESYAALFLRFRPSIEALRDGSRDFATRSEFVKLMDIPQLSSLTHEEVEDRYWDGLAPFWCEEGFTDAHFWTRGDTMHSLLEVARWGDIDVFNLLTKSGADASFWMRPRIYIPDPPTASSLCISTPLHVVIENSKHEMLQQLLDLGLDPNTMALANPTRCVTPLMATILHPNKFDKKSFDILSSQPNINFEIRTPVYDVHLLHFAVAKLDLPMLEHIVSKTSLKNAGNTALGHTLLHIACMPSNCNQIQRRSDLIMRSIHETRDTQSLNDRNTIPPAQPSERDFASQTKVVRYLWNQGIRHIEKKDVHGNTALHYLASCRGVNHTLITWWFQQRSIWKIWYESHNNHMATPSVLFTANEMVECDPLRAKPCATVEYRYSAMRAARKEAIWDGLLATLR